MTNTVTISLSLGSGPKAQELALRIKAWAAGKPISEKIRALILSELDKSGDMGLKSHSSQPI